MVRKEKVNSNSKIRFRNCKSDAGIIYMILNSMGLIK